MKKYNNYEKVEPYEICPSLREKEVTL